MTVVVKWKLVCLDSSILNCFIYNLEKQKLKQIHDTTTTAKLDRYRITKYQNAQKNYF